MITVSNLVKHHGRSRVLDGVNLTVSAGEVTAVVGPSGGGKSTLLRCLNALEQFESGSIRVDELELQGGVMPRQATLLELRRRVGMVFQQFNLFPHWTALENVMSGPRYVLKLSEAEARSRAEQLLVRVGLAEKAHAKPSQLSGGQQQRVAIARALAVNPSTILFDEPTSALDPAMSREVLAVLRDLASSGLTLIVVTHDMALAKEAQVVHIMERGKILYSGPPDGQLDFGPSVSQN